jgi:hypothetical protein
MVQQVRERQPSTASPPETIKSAISAAAHAFFTTPHCTLPQLYQVVHTL